MVLVVVVVVAAAAAAAGVGVAAVVAVVTNANEKCAVYVGYHSNNADMPGQADNVHELGGGVLKWVWT